MSDSNISMRSRSIFAAFLASRSSSSIRGSTLASTLKCVQARRRRRRVARRDGRERRTLWTPQRDHIPRRCLRLKLLIWHHLDLKLRYILQSGQSRHPRKYPSPIIRHCDLRGHHSQRAHEFFPQIRLSHAVDWHRSVDGDEIEEALDVFWSYGEELLPCFERQIADPAQFRRGVVELLRILYEALRMRRHRHRTYVFCYGFLAINSKSSRSSDLGRRLAGVSGVERPHNLIVNAQSPLPDPQHRLEVGQMAPGDVLDGDLHEHFSDVGAICLGAQPPNEAGARILNILHHQLRRIDDKLVIQRSSNV